MPTPRLNLEIKLGDSILGLPEVPKCGYILTLPRISLNFLITYLFNGRQIIEKDGWEHFKKGAEYLRQFDPEGYERFLKELCHQTPEQENQ